MLDAVSACWVLAHLIDRKLGEGAAIGVDEGEEMVGGEGIEADAEGGELGARREEREDGGGGHGVALGTDAGEI